jgi:hypothetical protein
MDREPAGDGKVDSVNVTLGDNAKVTRAEEHEIQMLNRLKK